jgi:hypothetical protein
MAAVRPSRHPNAAACDGGGILNVSTLTLSRSVVRDNASWWGGGIENGGILRVTASVVRGNEARRQGAASTTSSAGSVCATR